MYKVLENCAIIRKSRNGFIYSYLALVYYIKDIAQKITIINILIFRIFIFFSFFVFELCLRYVLIFCARIKGVSFFLLQMYVLKMYYYMY